MQKQNKLFLLLSFSMCFPFFLILQAQSNRSISLNSDWRFMSTTVLTPPNDTVLGQHIGHDGLITQLPNALFSALWENEAIEEQVSPKNASRLQWLLAKDWIFEHRFDVDKKVLEAENIQLVLRGVDTYAMVFINGFLVFKTDDASKIWAADVKPHLKPTGNLLSVFFVKTAQNDQPWQNLSNNASASRVKSYGLQSAELNLGNALIDIEKTPKVVPIIAAQKPAEQAKKIVKSEQVIAVQKPIEPPKKTAKDAPVVVAQKSVAQPKTALEDVTWVHKIENNTFKLTVINDRPVKATGYFFIDVYDLKGNHLFADMRMMYADAGSAVEFYRYDLKKFLQGADPANVVVNIKWRDALNEPQEIKKTFNLSKPTTYSLTKQTMSNE